MSRLEVGEFLFTETLTIAGQDVGMDGCTSGKKPWEWAWTIDILSLSIFIMFISPPSCTCVNKIPTNPCWNHGSHLWLSPPFPLTYATWVVTRSFSASIPTWHLWSEKIQWPLPPPTIGDNQKSLPQADLRHVKSRTCAWLSPIKINIDS